MIDFLGFKNFLSIEALIIFYYIGAVVMPVSMWFLMIWLVQKYELVSVTYQQGKVVLWDSLKTRQKLKLVAAFMIAFLFMELFWRMLFEFLIAYMQMRDAIVQVPIN